MLVTVSGSGKRVRAETEDFVVYCAQLLVPRMKSLSIEVELIPNLLSKEGIYGDCFPEDWADSYRPREFVIRADSRINKRDMLITVAHEMVHMKQFARGELYHSSVKHANKWKGKWYKQDSEYWDLPWEIEAHGRELGLFVRWARDRNLIKQKWTIGS